MVANRPTHAAQPIGLAPESPEASQLLESLDDAMFTAIAGEAASLDEARHLWLSAIAALSREQIEESREQYLRFAAEMTRRFELGERRNPANSLVALEIVELLTKA